MSRGTWTRVAALLSLSTAMAGCSFVPGGDKESVDVFVLRTSIAPLLRGSYRVDPSDCLTVTVNTPANAPGFGGARMFYMREAHHLEHFAYSRWATSVSSMVEPLLQQALRDGGRFRAVLAAPSPVSSDIRIQSDNLRMLQVFDEDGASAVEVEMNARAYSPTEGVLLAEATFRFAEPATPASPAGGVDAADRAIAKLLQAFADFASVAADRADGACEATS